MFERSRKWVNRLEHFDSLDSTNTYLERESAASVDAWPDFSAVVSDAQTAGQGRLGRDWMSPEGRSLAVSILLRSAAAPSWLSPAVSLSLISAIRSFGQGETVGLKWPNDVLIAERKLAGVLVRATGAGTHVVGVGVNLRPIAGLSETASSLEEIGITATSDEFLARFLASFRARYLRMVIEPVDFARDTRSEYLGECLTVGRSVRVELPDGRELRGIATGIDDLGRLLVASPTQYGESPDTVALAAGDVWHLRNL